MLHWLHPLLPHVAHYGYVFVFVTVFLNNIGIPLPGKTILLGAGFFLGNSAGSLWEPMTAGTTASFLGGICGLCLGRRLGHGGLENIRWLHLTPRMLKWPERFFKRHGVKSVFVARFIPFFPPVAANLMAGMAKIPWRIFLIYNLAGSAAWAVSFILIGYFCGEKWKLLEAWLGPTMIKLLFAAMALAVLGAIFRHFIYEFFARRRSKRSKRQPRTHRE